MLHTHRLLLQRVVAKDFDRFYEINADPQNNLFNPNGAMTHENARKAFDEILTHWDEKSFGTWCVRELHHPAFIIGFGGLSDRLYGDEIKLNLGYRFAKDYWGKGYATELAGYAIAYGLDKLNLQEIFAVVRPGHSASIKVLEKCKMTYSGELDDVPGQACSLIYKIEKKSGLR